MQQRADRDKERERKSGPRKARKTRESRRRHRRWMHHNNKPRKGLFWRICVALGHFPPSPGSSLSLPFFLSRPFDVLVSPFFFSFFHSYTRVSARDTSSTTFLKWNFPFLIAASAIHGSSKITNAKPRV
jgi:hypothetical protein